MTDTVGGAVRHAVTSLVRDARIEVIPLKGIEQKLGGIPKATTLTITCSPKFGLARTLEHAGNAVRSGYRVVPHLAARQVGDESELRAFVAGLDELGITDLYVIGGDADVPAGKYGAAAEVLEALATFEHGLTSIGVACYPEGHPKIGDAALAEALRRKQPLAHYLVSQLCFDPDVLVRWLTSVRREGITLPLHVGLAAPLNIPKLMQLSMRIGVGQSLSYLRKQNGLVGSMLRGNAYRPQALLSGMGSALTDPDMGIDSVHLFSFNQLDATAAWQREVAVETTGSGRR
jgi:methylenetetrahydrofolate reductase (NADPH)